ncbi:P-loop containing nucleoside triphosphate hydrolases superfamily protein isoform 1 [Hibiscus syriacus]|uniref:P-loop containing nucleoside triphosphate hydrolases superfamily protein isoform 1 n=1 Tax=Hibiscus syriacus TaxID=106335 RepID=A0A6A2ZMR8_HIBSY|nr:precursor of CEP5-like [Hibiscus syriacus]KAE8693311.1 P-loop containing nucleoside triphosphate hydrolases superfamily protein isoform 1 [Hibiscus syriacus]
MAQNRQLSLLVLLLLVFFLQIQFNVGRHLLLDQKETGTNVDKAAVGNTHSPPSPPTPVGGTQTPPPKNENDFRPTAPGHSPGAGHSLQN